MQNADWIDQNELRKVRGLYGMTLRLRDLDDTMSINMLTTLMYVAFNEGKTQVEIGRALGMKPSTMSRNITALTSVNFMGKPGLELVFTADHPTDRRAYLYFISPKGRALLLQVLSTI